MQVIELIAKLDELPEDSDVIILIDGFRHEDVTLIYDDELDEVILTGTEAKEEPPSLEEEFKAGFDEARG